MTSSTFTPPKSHHNHSPLHNFPLSNLKWSKNSPNPHRPRGPPDPPSPLLPSPPSNHSHPTPHSKRAIKLPICPPKGKKPKKAKPDDPEEEEDDDDDADVAWGNDGDDDEDNEAVAKTWNLRPRRVVKKTAPLNGNGGALKMTEKKAAPLVGERKKKRGFFSVSLGKEEIEEDFLVFTGAKPSRKPMKRVKGVQKLLDGVLPGLLLTTVTTDMYKVPEPPLKG